MKNLLLFLLLTPFIFYSQNKIDFSSDASIVKYIDSRGSNDPLEGLWKSYYGNILIQKGVNETYYAIYAGYKIIPPYPSSYLFEHTKVRKVWKPKDTIATFEFSNDKSLVFINSFSLKSFKNVMQEQKKYIKLFPNSITWGENEFYTLLLTPQERVIKTSEINTKSLGTWGGNEYEVLNGEGILKFLLITGESFNLIHYLYKFYPPSNMPTDNSNSKVISVENSKQTKAEAIKELKELKNLLDLGLITQAEFDNKSKELKKIILDN